MKNYEEFSRWLTTYAFIGWVLSHSRLSHKELAELAEEDGNKYKALVRAFDEARQKAVREGSEFDDAR